MTLRRLIILVILSAVQGCDNVSWGGIDLRLEGPQGSSDEAATAALDPEDDSAGPRFPRGPILFYGVREGSRASLVPVAEIDSTGLRPLPSEASDPGFIDAFSAAFLTPGERFTLFADGTRVGTLIADQAEVESSFCQPRPLVGGMVELVPGAASAETFLAIGESHTQAFEYEEFAPLSHDRDLRVASLTMMTDLIPQLGATWPPSVLDIRRDIQVFRLDERPEPAIVASFVYRDALDVGAAPDDAYSVFLLGTQLGDRYQPDYVRYRVAGSGGKATAHYAGRMDWDQDGEQEILLEVAGADSRWFTAIDRQNGNWVEVFEDSCGLSAGTP